MQDHLKGMLRDSHHLGSFTAIDKITGKWRYGITGTVSGLLGIIPQDTGKSVRQSFRVRQGTDEAIIKTTSWNQSVDTNDHHQLWGNLFHITEADYLPYMPGATYPQLHLMALVGYSYDPDPPEPDWHSAGLFLELKTYRSPSILSPSNKFMNDSYEVVMKSYVRRVEPFLRQVQAFVDFTL
uniref:Putative polymerase n=1 Tax=Craigmillar Park virus TaxID=1807811 RepID=A0A140HER3_9VIRU|nr:putative polymerase [Craigmillar Park virus]